MPACCPTGKPTFRIRGNKNTTFQAKNDVDAKQQWQAMTFKKTAEINRMTYNKFLFLCLHKPTDLNNIVGINIYKQLTPKR